MRKRNGVILAVIGCVVFFFCMEGWGADWRFYTTDTEGENCFYYDKESVSSPAKGVVRVWIRIINIDELNKRMEDQNEALLKSMRQKLLSEKREISKEEIDKSYAEYLEAYKEMQKNVLNYFPGPEKKVLMEVQCADRMSRFISGIEYDRIGKAFDNLSSSTTKWNHIVPGTMGEFLYKQVCK